MCHLVTTSHWLIALKLLENYHTYCLNVKFLNLSLKNVDFYFFNDFSAELIILIDYEHFDHVICV